MNFNKYVDWDGTPKYRKRRSTMVRKHKYKDIDIFTYDIEGDDDHKLVKISSKCLNCGSTKSRVFTVNNNEAAMYSTLVKEECRRNFWYRYHNKYNKVCRG